MLAAAGYKANCSRLALQVADECARDALFRHALGFFLLRADLHDGSAETLDSSLASKERVLFEVDIVNMNFRGEVRITVEQVFSLLEASGPVEVGDRGVLLQSLRSEERRVGKEDRCRV